VIAGVAVLVVAAVVRLAMTSSRRNAVRRRLPFGADPERSSAGTVATEWFAAADVTPVSTARAIAMTGVVGGAGLLLAGPPLALLLAGSCWGGPLLWLWLNRDRRDRRIEQLLPEALEAIARALRSGGSMLQAVEVAAASLPPPLGADLHRVAIEARHGSGLVPALERWSADRPLPGVRLAVAALALGAETGGAQARAVDGVAATLRQRLAVTAELRALSSQARMSAVVIAVAPLGFGLFASVTDGRTASFLLGTPLGLVCLAGGLLLDGVAAVWMHALTRPAQS
jgi:tight adherence protein B